MDGPGMRLALWGTGRHACLSRRSREKGGAGSGLVGEPRWLGPKYLPRDPGPVTRWARFNPVSILNQLVKPLRVDDFVLIVSLSYGVGTPCRWL